MTTCVFCRLLAGDLPASLVCRDDVCAVFMDIQPVNPGHVLVVPVAHAQLVSDLEPATLAHLATVAQRITSAVRVCGVRCEGVNWSLADGEAAGQEVPHVHLHVFPRFAGDGFGLTFGPDYSSRPARGPLD